MIRKKVLVFALILFPVFFSLAIEGEQPARVELNVVALAGPTGLSLVQMMEEEPELGPEVTVRYSVVRTPEKMTARIVSGEADIAAVPTNLAAVLYRRGIPVRLAAITNWGVMYLVGKDPTITEWEDLKGRELAVTGRGTTPDILLRYFLQTKGLDPDKDLTIRYYAAPVELVQLVIAGKVDLATLPEPWVTEAVQKNPEIKILLDYQEEWKAATGSERSYPQSCLVVRTELAEKKPGLVRDFLIRATAATEWVNKYPAAAAPLAEKYLFISAEAARGSVPRCNLQFIPAWEIREEIDQYLLKLYEFNPETVGGELPDADFYWQK